jgi:hypothetical protein
VIRVRPRDTTHRSQRAAPPFLSWVPPSS